MQAVASKGAPKMALNVYDLPSIEHAFHWMHASLGYPVAATWLKARRARNFAGFSFADTKYIDRYYPENDETPASHMTRQQQNIRSAKPNPVSLVDVDSTLLHRVKEQDVFIKIVNMKSTLYMLITVCSATMATTRRLRSTAWLNMLIDKNRSI